MVKNFMFAKSARDLTETSDKPAVLMFKAIKESAEVGKNVCKFYIDEFDKGIIDKLITLLTRGGYEVKQYSGELIIKW